MTPARGRRAATLAGAALLAAALPAAAASLVVRAGDGTQWRVQEDSVDGSDDYLLQRTDAQGRTAGGASGTPFMLGPDDDAPASLRVDASQRAWVTGATLVGNRAQPVVMRFGADGQPDTRWGVQGRQQGGPLGLAARPTDVLPLDDGSVLVAGSVSQAGGTRAIVWHLRPDGALDNAFGSGGVWTRPGGEAAFASALAVAADGTIGVAVVLRGRPMQVEVWALDARAATLAEHVSMDESTDEDDLRLRDTGGRWRLGDDGGPTAVVPPASLTRRSAPPPAASAPAADATAQGGFNPFESASAAAPAEVAHPVDDGPPWAWIGVAAALALGVAALLFRRGAAPATVRRG